MEKDIMDLHGNNPPVEHGRFEQILNQFLLKSLHIILDSRVPSIRMPFSRQHSGELKKSDKWFNLALGDRPAVLDNLNFWHRNLMEPMIIDIILVQDKPYSSSSGSRTPTTTSGLGNTLAETVIERWIVQYEHQRPVPMAMSPQSTGDVSYKKMYKKSIVLLRCLYSMMRLFPAYKAFRKLSSSSQTCEFGINYKVSAYCVPFSREEEELMKSYTFKPVDAQQGRFSLSVTYRENLSDYNLECLTPFPPQIIADYVGSPLADPLRAFPSSLEKGYHHGASLLSRGSPLPSSSMPSQRPHSWTSGLHCGVSSPQGQQHMAASPPMYRATSYECSSVPSDIHGPKQLHDYRSPVHQKALFFEHDYQLSPPFSPSPPTYFPSSTPTEQTSLRSETAPVSIPHQPNLGRSLRYLSPNLSDPNRSSLPPLSPRFVKNESSSQESASGARSLRRPESLRSGESSYGITNLGQKVSRDAKDDSGRFSGLLSSSDSPRVGFSRSSSRLSFQDDLDEFDFSCPFIVDDVDTSDSQASHNFDPRGGGSETSSRRSQDAAVGALVHMLRTAPPLRLDSSGYASRSEYPNDMGSGASSEFFLPRKTSDALEELKVYKEMKELLLSKSAMREVAGKEGAADSS